MLSPEVKGFEALLEAISSTKHITSALAMLILTLSNTLAVAPHTALQLSEMGIFRYLQPALFAPDASVFINAAFCVGAFATFPEAAALLGKSDVLSVCESVLHSIVPGLEQDPSPDPIVLYHEDVKQFEDMLGVDFSHMVKLCALHSAAFFATPCNKRVLQRATNFVALVRQCTMSGDAFLYTSIIYILKSLGLATPSFCEKGHQPDDEATHPPEKWSVDAVCTWVSEQVFSVRRSLRVVFCSACPTTTEKQYAYRTAFTAAPCYTLFQTFRRALTVKTSVAAWRWLQVLQLRLGSFIKSPPTTCFYRTAERVAQTLLS